MDLIGKLLSLLGLGKTISPVPPEPDYSVRFTTPTPTPTPPVPTPTLLPEAPPNPYIPLIQKYFVPAEYNNASNIMFKESTFRPDVIHENADQYNSKDYGLYQGNDYWQRENLKKLGLTPQDLLDPETAIRFAAWLQAQEGWSPWNSAKSLGL